MDEEQYCHERLNEIRRAYEITAKPYIDRLVRIHSMRIDPIYVTMEQDGMISTASAKPAPDHAAD